MPDPVITTQLHREARLHFAAMLYFLSRFAVVAFFFAVPALYFLRGRIEPPFVWGGALLVVSMLVAYYTVAGGLQCPACAGPVLIDNGNRKHLYARRLPGLNQRARVAWDILFGSTWHCMYCHSMCRCKKQRGGQPAHGTGHAEGAHSRHGTIGEPFPGSVFGDDGDSEDDSFGPFVSTESDPELDLEAAIRSRRPGILIDSAFPEEKREFPTPPEFPYRSAPREVAGNGAAELETTEDSPAPFFATPKFTPSVPLTASEGAANPADAPIMNRPALNLHHEHGPNPFLAAAAAMPPPPTPTLPLIPGVHDRGRSDQLPADVPAPFRQEFPHPPARLAESEGPPPWTLPSLPVAAERQAALRPIPAAPVAPSIPDFSPSVRMHDTHASPAFASETLRGLPDAVIKEVLSVLEDGYRSVNTAFRSVIEKLESRLAPPAPALPAHATAARPPSEPASLPFPVMPVLPAIPEPVAASPVEKTTRLPALPPLPAVSPLSSPIADAPPPSVPRRRFARPSGAAAQQLSSALQDVFESPPTVPALIQPLPADDPGYFSRASTPEDETDVPRFPGHAATPPSPPVPVPVPETSYLPPSARGIAPSAPFQVVKSGAIAVPVAAHSPQAIPADQPDSPFAMSDSPLTAPPDAPPPPAPFTFLHSNGDHFAPIASEGPAYDPLDDTPLPWMQPIT